MCHVRAYRYTCGHSSHRPVSACRFTYASPHSNERPLCHAGPELVMTCKNECRPCQYQTFCHQWETKIADARSRQSAARQLLLEIQEECHYDDEDYEWGPASEPSRLQTSSSSYSHGRPLMADYRRYTDGGLFSSSSWVHPSDAQYQRHNSGYGFGDSEAVSRERERTEREVESLWTQYQREQWTAWRSFVSGPSSCEESHVKRSFRKRRTSSRQAGSSPLQSTTLSEELPDPEPRDEDEYDDGVQSPLSSSTSSASFNSSVASVASSATELDEDHLESPDGFTKSWKWPTSGSSSEPTSPTMTTSPPELESGSRNEEVAGLAARLTSSLKLEQQTRKLGAYSPSPRIADLRFGAGEEDDADGMLPAW